MRYALFAVIALAACGSSTKSVTGNNDGDGKVTVIISRQCVHTNANGTVTAYAPPCAIGDTIVVISH